MAWRRGKCGSLKIMENSRKRPYGGSAIAGHVVYSAVLPRPREGDGGVGWLRGAAQRGSGYNLWLIQSWSNQAAREGFSMHDGWWFLILILGIWLVLCFFLARMLWRDATDDRLKCWDCRRFQSWRRFPEVDQVCVDCLSRRRRAKKRSLKLGLGEGAFICRVCKKAKSGEDGDRHNRVCLSCSEEWRSRSD